MSEQFDWNKWAAEFAAKRELEQREFAAKYIAKAGNSMTANYGGVEYIACRPVVEYVAGQPVFGPWVLRSADMFTDADGIETFCTASELTERMAKIPFAGMPGWKFVGEHAQWYTPNARRR